MCLSLAHLHILKSGIITFGFKCADISGSEMTDGHRPAAVFYRKEYENVIGHPDGDLENMFWQTVAVTLCHFTVEPFLWHYVLL